MTSKKPVKKKKKSTLKKAGKLFKESYFPTVMYYRDLPDAEVLNSELKKDIYAWKRKDKAGIVRSNMASLGSWHSAVDMNQREEYRDLLDIITITVQQIYEDQSYDPEYEPVCDNMWANISPRYGFNRNHTHPNVLWSGVYYVQAPEKSGRVYFTDPRVQAHMVTPHLSKLAGDIRETWSEVFYEPVEGRMIIFPAWLGHEVEPNLSALKGRAGERISVAFNFIQRKRE